MKEREREGGSVEALELLLLLRVLLQQELARISAKRHGMPRKKTALRGVSGGGDERKDHS